MRIAVVGSGGVGGYFGGRLAASGNEVTFIARGPHLAAIRGSGLAVRSVKGDFTVTASAHEDPEDVGPCDVVLFCVKSYDTDAVAARIGPLIGGQTAVVTLQNGVDNVPKLSAAIGEEHVVGGAAFIFSTIVEPGVIAHTGGPARIVFGEMNGDRTPRVERLLEACQQAGIDADVPPDIRVTLWTKFAFICALAGMTASVRLPLGEIRDSAESWPMFRRIADEVVALARAEGVPVERQRCRAAGRLRRRAGTRLVLLAAPRPGLRTAHGARGAARRRCPLVATTRHGRPSQRGDLPHPAPVGVAERDIKPHRGCQATWMVGYTMDAAVVPVNPPDTEGPRR